MKLINIASAILAAAASASAHGGFTFSHLWTFNHTAANGSSGLGSEIVSYDDRNQRLWVVGTDANGANLGRSGIDVLDLNGKLVRSIDLQPLGGVNSVAVANGKAAVAITAPVKTDPGLVRFYDARAFSVLATRNVGANPDAVTFTPNGQNLLLANEGEPSSYLIGPAGDPVGSVSIIDARSFRVRTAGFEALDGEAAALKAAGVRLTGPNASVAQDLEPEYIAVSADGNTAAVTLQEANAVALVDIGRAKVTAINPMGFKDQFLQGNGLDASDRDGDGNAPLNGNIRNWKIKGLYMPDGIAGFTQNDRQYYVTANEGDSRADWPGGNDEVRIGDLVNSVDPLLPAIDPALDASLIAAHGSDWRTNNDLLSRLNASSTTGDTDGDGDYDELQVFGARSFSILDSCGRMVFDSGDQVEQIIKNAFPQLWDDARSDNKGPEPESAVIGRVSGHTLLFLGLERAHAIMVWDLTDLRRVRFLDMLFTAGDRGPEGVKFFRNGKDHYVAVANEVSATTTLYKIDFSEP